ncbi:MAG: sulfurtransferase-like selenium metabolism protein YedF [Alphaproteobacteria bacterium]|uniref:Sulfurtransferase-like selenium metabolism protein YedF n=1 Tax=Candidatus Nitrobium versatile TaxID=2884831 RepID=A0A953LVV9_9BACT|nr:sulfurtransferase-like selenium metabolism protein YedF [Candidatus Nitrobium versatile]
MKVDARGLGCPKPVVMAEDALSKIEEGIVTVLVDNEASVKNITRFAGKSRLCSEAAQANGHWEVKIVKGYPCEAPAEGGARKQAPPEPADRETEKGPEEPEKDVMLIVGSDTLGKDEVLGKVLMKGFFETMNVTKETPHTVFLLNAAVKLATIDEEMIPILKDLADKGVEIFSCGTCLQHYGLERELKVGYRGTSYHIVEGIKDFKKTVWIG